jgi:hypothetical protein
MNQNKHSYIDGLEAIKFQRSSNLGAGLTAIFNEVFTFIKKYDSNNEMDSRTKVFNKYIDVENFFVNNCISKFKDLVKKETNIIVNKFTTIPVKETSCMFAIDLSLDNPKDVNELIMKLSGQESYKDMKKTMSMEELLNIHNLIDKETGKFKSSEFGKNRKIIADIYFDIGSAFFSNDLLPNVENLIAEEITAIMLHEIGHMITLAERSGDMFYLGQYVTHSIYQLSKTTDPIELLTKHKDKIKNLINKAYETKQLNEFKYTTMMTTVDKLSDFVKSENVSLPMRLVLTIINTALWLILSLCTLLLIELFFVDIFIISYISHFLLQMMKADNKSAKLNLKQKSSDDTYTIRSVYHPERLADEFVSRHGYGSYLGSALQKLSYFADTYGSVNIVRNSPYVSKTVTKYYLAYRAFFGKIASFDRESILPTYEKDLDRLERLLQNNMSVFKNRNIPKTMLSAYLKDTESLMKIVASEKKNYARKIEVVLWDYLLLIRGGEILYETIRNGRLSTDMEKMLNKLDNLVNNRLYYYSGKLLEISTK